jgi:hypothetical protein
MAISMVNSAMPKAMADWAKKAEVFFAEVTDVSMAQPSPVGRGRGIGTGTQIRRTTLIRCPGVPHCGM